MRSRNTSCRSRPSAGGCPWLSITRAACWDSCRAVYARNDLLVSRARRFARGDRKMRL